MIVAAMFRQFRIKIDMAFDTHRKMEASAFDDFFDTMKNMQKPMRFIVGGMGKEIAAAD